MDMKIVGVGRLDREISTQRMRESRKQVLLSNL